jgi:probable rRNA maturation factor
MTIHTNLNLTNDQKTSAMHEQFFGDASVTDTMSFPISEPTPDGDYYLGDIVVNYDQLKRQAEELSIPQKEELARLITHSALHLMGLDDATETGSTQMRESENTILSKLFSDSTPRDA